ncbi:hypothetical protein ACSV9I_12535 [Rhizobium sp. G187]|uniref:hypothetical protein n=1 Tax=unclassified Rhizobium TaxID=2613769 RepID=UPI0006B97190|nr:hypothetical protein [Rhizobium sp. AAP43]KPF46522.1 hypothetical protein IP76_06580 [Rhizobium sp. AAP43]
MGGFRQIAFPVVLAVVVPCSASANGLGDDRPYQFRSANERQVLLNLERTRLELQGRFNTGVGSAAGLGTQQTGNSTTINVTGSNNDITVTQDHNGDQTIDQNNSNNSILNN